MDVQAEDNHFIIFQDIIVRIQLTFINIVFLSLLN